MNVTSHNLIDVDVASARVAGPDAVLLAGMWCVVFVASVFDLGGSPAYIFAMLSVVAIYRSSLNGLLVLILIAYSPAHSLVGLPVGPYALVSVATLVRMMFFCGDRGLPWNGTLAAALAFSLYATFSVIISFDRTTSLDYYERYLEGCLVLLVLFGAVRDSNALGSTLKAVVWFAALGAFIKWAHITLGSDAALWSVVEESSHGEMRNVEDFVLILLEGTLQHRLIWPGSDPNYVSTDLVFPLSLAVGLAACTKGATRYVWAIGATLIGLSIVGTFSRSGFLVATVMLTLFLVLGRTSARVLLLLVGAGISLAPFLFDGIATRLQTIGAELTGFGGNRYVLWSSSVDIWATSPILGAGLGSLASRGVSSHNTFLQILAETGMLGFMLFLAVPLTPFAMFFAKRRMLARRRVSDTDLVLPVMIGLLGMTLIIGTVSYFDIKLYWLTCGVCALVVLNAKRNAAWHRLDG